MMVDSLSEHEEESSSSFPGDDHLISLNYLPFHLHVSFLSLVLIGFFFSYTYLLSIQLRCLACSPRLNCSLAQSPHLCPVSRSQSQILVVEVVDKAWQMDSPLLPFSPLPVTI